jgi:hypothetical protein
MLRIELHPFKRRVLGFTPTFLAGQMNAAAMTRLASPNPSAVARHHGRLRHDHLLAVALWRQRFKSDGNTAGSQDGVSSAEGPSYNGSSSAPRLTG